MRVTTRTTLIAVALTLWVLILIGVVCAFDWKDARLEKELQADKVALAKRVGNTKEAGDEESSIENSVEDYQRFEDTQADLSSTAPQVFISYNSVDAETAQHLAQKLKGAVNVWMDDQLNLGDPVQQELESKLKSCKAIAVLIGTRGAGPWQNEEMRAAFYMSVHDPKVRIIPIILPGASPKVSLPPFLLNRKYFELGTLADPEVGKLVTGVKTAVEGNDAKSK